MDADGRAQVCGLNEKRQTELRSRVVESDFLGGIFGGGDKSSNGNVGISQQPLHDILIHADG
jgi:hypothetical protein